MVVVIVLVVVSVGVVVVVVVVVLVVVVLCVIAALLTFAVSVFFLILRQDRLTLLLRYSSPQDIVQFSYMSCQKELACRRACVLPAEDGDDMQYTGCDRVDVMMRVCGGDSMAH